MLIVIPKHLEEKFREIMEQADWDTFVIDHEGGKESNEDVKYYIKEKIPEDLRWEILERDNFTCKKCGSRKYLHIDHIKPESKGGETVKENLQVLCKNCNIRKGSKY